MPQSLANVLLHIVFSTKNRAPFLQDPGIREEMNGYMVGTLKAIECPSLIVRTVDDHLHCLCQLSRTMSIAKLVEEMKVESSSWAKKTGASPPRLSLAGGVRCVFGQPIQRRLKRHEIEFDERYVWD